MTSKAIELAAGPDADSADRRAWWSVLVPFAIAVLALIAVGAVLITIGRQTADLRGEMAVIGEPARATVFDLQRTLALEMAAQHRYRLGGEERSLGTYRELRKRERELLERLLPAAHALGPDAVATLADVRAHAELWHAGLDGGESRRQDGAEPGLSIDRGDYAAALAATERLAQEIDSRLDAQRARLVALEETEDRLVLLLSIPATLSIGVLFWIGRRLHRLSTEARGLAATARRRQRELEEVSREKERFIRGVTHDIKNPLGIIDGYAELLEMGLKGELTSEQGRMVRKIRRATSDATAIIHDLLELARAESRGLPLDLDRVDVAALAMSTAEDYRDPIEAAGLDLALDEIEEIPAVQTDPTRIREVLGNLLTNALKYTPPGGRVAVRTRLGGDPLQRGTPFVAVDVSDTGPGIAADDQARIFDEFERGDDGDGAGLGLAISRRMARALGGDLVVASTPGNGATFTLLLPIEPADEPTRVETGRA